MMNCSEMWTTFPFEDSIFGSETFLLVAVFRCPENCLYYPIHFFKTVLAATFGYLHELFIFCRQISAIGNECSKCHWLERCFGCPVFEKEDDGEKEEESSSSIRLLDGITFAIDWHFQVFEVTLYTILFIRLLCL